MSDNRAVSPAHGKAEQRMALHAPVQPRTRFLLVTLLPALTSAATALSLALFSISVDEGQSRFVLWLLLVVLSAPAVAFVVNRHWPAATNTNRAFLTALPQPIVVPLMLRFVVWRDIQSGLLLRDSGEEAMAYGILTSIGLVIGLALLLLVAVAGNRGALLADR